MYFHLNSDELWSCLNYNLHKNNYRCFKASIDQAKTQKKSIFKLFEMISM